jgi:membrane protease YdiL (CAAX protease family)
MNTTVLRHPQLATRSEEFNQTGLPQALRANSKRIWLSIILVETVFFIMTRWILGQRWAVHQDAFLIATEWRRSALRIIAAVLYIGMVPPLLAHLVRPGVTASIIPSRPALLVAIVVFVCMPLFEGTAASQAVSVRVVFAVTSLAVALKEEITFRALMQNLFEQKLGRWPAVLLASGLFWFSHFGVIAPNVFAYSEVLIAGLALGIVYATTRSLLLVLSMHFLYDAAYSLQGLLPAFIDQKLMLVFLLAVVSLALVAGNRRQGASSP